MWAEQKISVIIPVYNTGRFVKEAIDSVRNQTYENLEIIAVDDGSSDNAGQICDEIASGDARVKVIHQANAGVSAARNKGLDNATGDYIAFLDSDDTYVIDALEYLKSVLEKENGDFIYGRMLRMNEFGVFEKVNQSYGEDYEVLTREEFWKSKKNLTGKAVVYVKLYKASIFKTVRFKEGYIHEDEGILWEIVSQCDRIISSDKPVVNYRVRLGSITHRPFYFERLNLSEVLVPEIAYFQGLGDIENMTAYFGTGIRNLEKGYYKLEHSEKVIKKIKEIYLQYKPFAKYIKKHTKSFQTKVRMQLFLTDIKLYFIVRRVLKAQ